MSEHTKFNMLSELIESSQPPYHKPKKSMESPSKTKDIPHFLKDLKKKFGVIISDSLKGEQQYAFYEYVKSNLSTTKISESDDVDEKSDKSTERKLSKNQKAYQKFFDKLLKKYNVESPAELDKDERKKFYAEVDKGWNSEAESGKDGLTESKQSLSSILLGEAETVGTKDKPVKVIKKKDEDSEEKTKNLKIQPRDEESDEEELVIEFPEGVYLALEFDGEVNGDAIKIKAQKLYQLNKNPVEIALELAKEFKSSDWEIGDISTLSNDSEDDDHD